MLYILAVEAAYKLLVCTLHQTHWTPWYFNVGYGRVSGEPLHPIKSFSNSFKDSSANKSKLFTE